MKKVKEIDFGELKKVVRVLNSSGLLDFEIPFKGLTREDQRDLFVESVEKIPDDEKEKIPSEVVKIYNDVVSDEASCSEFGKGWDPDDETCLRCGENYLEEYQECKEKCEKSVVVKDVVGLPATVEELHSFILIGKERLNAQKAKIRAIEKVDMASAAKEAALIDAQDMGEILLDAEAKFGEMLSLIKPKRKKESSSRATSLPSLPKGVTKKESHQAQVIAKSPEVVVQMKKKARERGEIVTSRKVLKEIKKAEKPKKTKTKKRLELEKIFTEEFETAFDLFFNVIQEAKKNKWEKISKEAVRCHLKKIARIL